MTPAPHSPAEVRAPVVQRKCACATGRRCDCDEQVQRLAEPGAARDPAASRGGPAREPLLVDDDAPAGPAQMRRTEFLDRLRTTVCATADEELARVGRDTSACPYLERLFGHYARRDAVEVETALVGYAPEAARARSALELLPLVAERVRRSTARWVETGELPSGIGPAPSPSGVLGAVLGGFGALSGVAGMLGGGLFAKRREDAAGPANGDAAGVRARLDGGDTIDAGTRRRMETALGHDFSRVRVHADPAAGAVARQLSARAFTVGNDVAFAPGEYRPGTLVGDAVLAHELAHVVQQRQGVEEAPGATRRDALEEDADVAAANAVASMRGLGDRSLPRLRSGLRLQRCAATPPAGAKVAAPVAEQIDPQTPAGKAFQDKSIPTTMACNDKQRDEIRALVGPASLLMQAAISALEAPDKNKELIEEHFGPGADTGSIKAIYETAKRRMTGGDFAYACVDRRAPGACHDPTADIEDAGGMGVHAITNTDPARFTGINEANPYVTMITWCGDVAVGKPFLPAGGAYDWVATMVHESLHTVEGVLTADVEKPKPQMTFPPMKAHKADRNPHYLTRFAKKAAEATANDSSK